MTAFAAADDARVISRIHGEAINHRPNTAPTGCNQTAGLCIEEAASIRRPTPTSRELHAAAPSSAAKVRTRGEVISQTPRITITQSTQRRVVILTASLRYPASALRPSFGSFGQSSWLDRYAETHVKRSMPCSLPGERQRFSPTDPYMRLCGSELSILRTNECALPLVQYRRTCDRRTASGRIWEFMLALGDAGPAYRAADALRMPATRA